ncbi:MAG: DUF1015 domain-containing protein [Proteobacteria bacterium]|nr:DUF1015 domain-containing protein [Pseudomonadota bacterium]MBU1738123.1 DUF1015 domain-containing protein [Pseudomonadota bacterium]
MAIIAPFRGLRYNKDVVSRLEEVVTPPYDVINAKGQQDLLEKNPYNMIQLDLGKTSQEAVSDERYSRARQLLDTWQSEGILQRDEDHSIYLYFIDYQHPSGRRFTRKGLICLTGLAEFSEGIVKPHEKVFRGVVTDRLRLLDACRTQFSQVFAVYPDEMGEVMAALESAKKPEPLAECEDQDGCRHSLWQVSDREAIARARALFAAKSVYIADGHHRYTTALQMREKIAGMEGRKNVAADSSFNFVMMYLCAIEDPGLSVLPTHRLVRLPETSADALVAKLGEAFQVKEVAGGTREVLVAEVLAGMDEARDAATVFGLYHPGEDRCFLLRMKDGAMAGAGLDTIPAPLRELDVVVLSELILGHHLGLDHEICVDKNLIDYFSDPDEALDKAVKESAGLNSTSVIFLMNNTLVSQVKNVSDAELVMPHKSTYFYPKILTGMVMNQLVDGEKVDV